MTRQWHKFVLPDLRAACDKPRSGGCRSCLRRENGWESGLPVSDKDVEFPGSLGVPGRGKNQFFSVVREHREAVEAGAVSDSP